MAQWIRRWSTKPEILGSIPSGVELLKPSFLTSFFWLFPCSKRTIKGQTLIAQKQERGPENKQWAEPKIKPH
jgi:hypothetical protein